MEQDLQAMLVPLERVHWGRAPQTALRPFVVLNRVSGVRGYTNGGRDGLVRSRVQADVYADTYQATKEAARHLVAAVSGRRLGVIRAVFIDNERDLPAADAGEVTHLFRTSIDLAVTHRGN